MNPISSPSLQQPRFSGLFKRSTEISRTAAEELSDKLAGAVEADTFDISGLEKVVARQNDSGSTPIEKGKVVLKPRDSQNSNVDKVVYRLRNGDFHRRREVLEIEHNDGSPSILYDHVYDTRNNYEYSSRSSDDPAWNGPLSAVNEALGRKALEVQAPKRNDRAAKQATTDLLAVENVTLPPKD